MKTLLLALVTSLSISASALTVAQVLDTNSGEVNGALEGATPLHCAFIVYPHDEEGRWVKAHYGVGILMARFPAGGHWQIDEAQSQLRFVYDDPEDFMTFEFDPGSLRVIRFFKTTQSLKLRACAL